METYTPQPKDRLYSEQQVFWGTLDAINTLPLLGLLTKEGKKAIVDHITEHLRTNLPEVVIPGWNNQNKNE
jgi:hypothetical protein